MQLGLTWPLQRLLKVSVPYGEPIERGICWDAHCIGIRYHGLPEGEDASFFLCKELVPGYLDGVIGEYATPSGYFVDVGEAEKFDKQFPEKEKMILPGQLW